MRPTNLVSLTLSVRAGMGGPERTRSLSRSAAGEQWMDVSLLDCGLRCLSLDHHVSYESKDRANLTKRPLRLFAH